MFYIDIDAVMRKRDLNIGGFIVSMLVYNSVDRELWSGQT